MPNEMGSLRALGATSLLAAMLAGCGGGGDTEVAVPLPFTVVATTFNSGVERQETVVAAAPAELSQLWARFVGSISPAPALPGVDLSALQVAGVFLGTRPGGCYGVAITRVTRMPGQQVTVAWRERTPGPAELCTAAITTPAQLVAFPRSDLPVVFAQE